MNILYFAMRSKINHVKVFFFFFILPPNIEPLEPLISVWAAETDWKDPTTEVPSSAGWRRTRAIANRSSCQRLAAHNRAGRWSRPDEDTSTCVALRVLATQKTPFLFLFFFKPPAGGQSSSRHLRAAAESPAVVKFRGNASAVQPISHKYAV